MFKQLSTISLISLYIGNCFQTDEDEAFSKQIGAELVNRVCSPSPSTEATGTGRRCRRRHQASLGLSE